MNFQRYISPELTHFVGRKKKNREQQYEVLEEILRKRCLGLASSPYTMEVYPEGNLSTNKAYNAGVVCFCDIPIGDLEIHMRKYSRFGIAFTKKYLLDKGATPVMYIPRRGLPAHPAFGKRIVSTAAEFDEFYRRYEVAFREVRSKSGAVGELKRKSRQFREVMHFLDVNILSHLKFFDPLTAEGDKNNFYMEREWRVLDNVHFALADVRRIIVPRRYGRDLRKHFPKYVGEVTFAD
jgi:hypothetical protein